MILIQGSGNILKKLIDQMDSLQDKRAIQLVNKVNRKASTRDLRRLEMPFCCGILNEECKV